MLAEIMYGCANNKSSDMHEGSALNYSYNLENLNLKMSLFKVAYARKSGYPYQNVQILPQITANSYFHMHRSKFVLFFKIFCILHFYQINGKKKKKKFLQG